MDLTALNTDKPPTPESKKSTLFTLTLGSDNLKSLYQKIKEPIKYVKNFNWNYRSTKLRTVS